MKANEIRIGNLFSHTNENGTFNIVVKEILESGINTHFNNGTWFIELDNINPILLTEEKLLKAGGKRFDEDKIILMLNDPSTHLVLMKVGTHWFPQIEQTGEFASEGVNVVFLNFIDYIHQLQNLFFCLCGEEIKIEL